MRHLGRAPQWVSISGRVEFPSELSQTYDETMKKSVIEFETEFSNRLNSRSFFVTPMVVQPRGLDNTGLMCFVNSSFQLLFASPPFVSFANFMKLQYPLFSPQQRKITPAWGALCNFLNDFRFSDCATTDGSFSSLKALDMIENTSSTDTRKLDKVFGPFSSNRSPRQQEDSGEFLSYFLNVLHDELLNLIKLAPIPKDDEGPWKTEGTGRKNIVVTETQGEFSPLSDLFSSIVRSETLSFKKSRSMNTESNLVLPLPIINITKLEVALSKFVEEEQITDEISKKTSFMKFPMSLIIGLKRFSYNDYGLIKLKHIVEYPEILSLTTLNASEPKNYQLSAVVVHIGNSPTSGHYVCYGRRFDGTWLLFDDSKVTPLPGDCSYLGLQAYLLLYNRTNK